METPFALSIRQFRRATFRAVQNGSCALIRVQTGVKRVQVGSRMLEVPAGALAVMAPRQSMTIENCPEGLAPYAAQLLVVPESFAAAAFAETGAGDAMRATVRPTTLAAFDRAVSYAQDPQVPQRLKSHALREVLLWLGEEGIGFGRPRPALMADRLRGVLAKAPDHDWRAPDAARALAVSEPTLRRHLAHEGTTFSDLLTDVRMGQALTLLQTSDLSVTRVALDVGYACPSRFAVRFRQRFGLSPSDIRSRAPETV